MGRTQSDDYDRVLVTAEDLADLMERWEPVLAVILLRRAAQILEDRRGGVNGRYARRGSGVAGDDGRGYRVRRARTGDTD